MSNGSINVTSLLLSCSLSYDLVETTLVRTNWKNDQWTTIQSNCIVIGTLIMKEPLKIQNYHYFTNVQLFWKEAWSYGAGYGYPCIVWDETSLILYIPLSTWICRQSSFGTKPRSWRKKTTAWWRKLLMSVNLIEMMNRKYQEVTKTALNCSVM